MGAPFDDIVIIGVGETRVGKRAMASGSDRVIHAAALVAARTTMRFIEADDIVQIEMNPVVLRADGAFPVDVFVVGSAYHGG